MSQKGRMQRLGLALATAGALSLSAWTGAEARPFGLLLGGGLHHPGGFGAFHPLGGFGGLRPPGFGRGFYGGAVGFRQAGFGYPGFRQAGYRGFGSPGETRRWRDGRGRRYWGAYAAPLAVGATGAYAYGYPRSDSGDNGYSPPRYNDYPAYRN